MAITIDNSPSIYQSFHDDLWYVVSSNNTGQQSFKYVFDVYINTNLVARVKSFPQPGTGKGLFNVAPIIRNYWASYFQPAITKTAFNYVGSGNRVNYVVKFGEEYNATLYTNLSEDDRDALNYYPSVFNGGGAFDGTWYWSSYQGVPMTTRSNQSLTTTYTGSRLFLTIQNQAINTPFQWQLNVTRYNSGAQTSVTGGFVTINDIAVLDLSPAAINQYLGTSFITSATSNYIVDIQEDIAGTQYLAYVDILCESRYANIPIHFLNSLGGYDTMNFSLVNKQTRNVEKKSFEEIEWQYRSGDMHRVNQYNVFNGGSKQFNTAQTISYKLTSDWLSLVDYTWLKDLIASPEVYMEQGGYFIPVTIGTSSWTEKKRYADKTYNLELDINLGTKEFSQYR
jgi:hypothetical protein